MGKSLIKGKQIEQISSENIDEFINPDSIGADKLSANVSDSELETLQNIKGNVQAALDDKVDKSSVKSVDETDWSSDTIITTALAIAKKIEQAIAEASIGASYFKDAWSKATIPISKGWSYVYDEGEAPSELNLEPGDYLIAKVDIASEAAKMIGSNWVVVQVNLDGAVTSSINLTDGKIVIGAGGKSVRVSDISGVIKATNGTIEQATGDDLPQHKHNRNFKIDNGDGTFSEINSDTDSAIVLSSEIASEIAQKAHIEKTSNGIKFVFPFTLVYQKELVEIEEGSESGYYVEDVDIINDKVLVKRAKLKQDDIASIYKANITPAGTKDGVNVEFILPDKIQPTTLSLFLNGQLLERGFDYTISGEGNKVITFSDTANIPISTDRLIASYVKQTE